MSVIWKEVTLTNGTESVTLTVTGRSRRAWFGIPLGADRERPKRGPDTRDSRVVFPRPEWQRVAA